MLATSILRTNSVKCSRNSYLYISYRFLNSGFYLERRKELISIERRGELDSYLKVANPKEINYVIVYYPII